MRGGFAAAWDLFGGAAWCRGSSSITIAGAEGLHASHCVLAAHLTSHERFAEHDSFCDEDLSSHFCLGDPGFAMPGPRPAMSSSHLKSKRICLRPTGTEDHSACIKFMRGIMHGWRFPWNSRRIRASSIGGTGPE
jgi:hypothetical protein